MSDDKLEVRNKLVNTERKRLEKLFSKIPKQKKSAVEGLIIQAARLRVLLDDNWEDISKKGDYELFSQGKEDPYDRKRPIADLYNNRDKSYQSVIKQLIDLLPEEEKGKVEPFAKSNLL